VGDATSKEAGFLLEALEAIRVGGEFGGKNFDGDIATEAGVAGAVVE
jgi:hypothetical protein